MAETNAEGEGEGGNHVSKVKLKQRMKYEEVKGDNITILFTCELFNFPPTPFECYAVIFFENVIARRVQQVSLIVIECWSFGNCELLHIYRTKGIRIKGLCYLEFCEFWSV